MKALLTASVVAALARVFAGEAEALLSWLPARMICWAAKHFPESDRDRFKEEWLAHSNDLPGNTLKLWHASGCIITYLQCTGSFQKVVWWMFCSPIWEAVFLIHLARVLVVEWSGKPHVFRFDPEIMRSYRLQKAAAGVQVLGLHDLSIHPVDRVYKDRKVPVPADPTIMDNLADAFLEDRLCWMRKVVIRLFWS